MATPRSDQDETGGGKITRRRLSSIDLLPPEAEEDVVWALAEIRKGKATQEDIRESFNLRLRVKGIPEISRSAFNRHALRAIRMAQRMGEVQEIASALTTRFEEGADESLTLLVSETIKTLVFEVLENAGKLRADGMTAEMMMNLSRALKHAEEAKKVSADTRKVIDKEFKSKAAAAIDQVVKTKGLTEDVREELRRDLFGVVDGPRNRT